MASRDEQRKALQAQLAELDAADADDEAEFEYEIGRGDNYARVSSKSKAGKKIAKFFKDAFDIDLDDEPVQDDEPEPDEGKGKAKPGRQQAKGENVRAFSRRIG